MTNDELKGWLEKVERRQEERDKELHGHLDTLAAGQNEIKINCAGRCGLVREIGRLAAAVIGGAAAALGVSSWTGR